MQERTREEERPQRLRRSKRFHGAMTVGEAIDLHPRARWVISSYQFGGCGHCGVSNEETLAAVAETYAIPLEKLLGELNGL
jgi:hypothetical protein